MLFSPSVRGAIAFRNNSSAKTQCRCIAQYNSGLSGFINHGGRNINTRNYVFARLTSANFRRGVINSGEFTIISRWTAMPTTGCSETIGFRPRRKSWPFFSRLAWTAADNNITSWRVREPTRRHNCVSVLLAERNLFSCSSRLGKRVPYSVNAYYDVPG